MTNNKKWINLEGTFRYANIPKVNEKLPAGVYELNTDMGGFFLSHISDNFGLPSHVYGTETDLIERVQNSFTKFDKNFGVLLKGLKGTGKTVTAKQICNNLKLPVILVNRHFGDIGSFINSIQQDIVLFFDEFEKTYQFSHYDDEDENSNDAKAGVGGLLTLMDGVFTSDYKRLFILTTNKDYLPDAMMSRPSRIRYVKSFDDLSFESINEILNDIVANKSLIPELINILKELDIVTVDIVKAVAEEANLYNTADPKFFDLFNVKKQKSFNQLFELGVKGKEDKMLIENIHYSFETVYKGYNLVGDDGTNYSVVNKDLKTKLVTLVPIHNLEKFKKGEKVAIKNALFKKATKAHKSFLTF